MAGDTTELAGARPITLAQRHGEVMLQQDRLRRRVAVERHLENGRHIVERSPRPEILFLLPWLDHANVAALVAFHADVIGQPAWQARGVHDVGVDVSGRSASGLPLGNVPFTGAVASLAADRQLGKGRIPIPACLARYGLRPPAVAADALRQNQPAEPVIAQLVPGREPPGSRLRVIRQWRLKQVAIAPDYKAKAVLARSKYIGQRPRLPKNFLSAAVEGVLALVKLPIFSRDFEELPGFLVQHRKGYGKPFDERLVVARDH
jgi:hypothetical protein